MAVQKKSAKAAPAAFRRRRKEDARARAPAHAVRRRHRKLSRRPRAGHQGAQRRARDRDRLHPALQVAFLLFQRARRGAGAGRVSPACGRRAAGRRARPARCRRHRGGTRARRSGSPRSRRWGCPGGITACSRPCAWTANPAASNRSPALTGITWPGRWPSFSAHRPRRVDPQVGPRVQGGGQDRVVDVVEVLVGDQHGRGACHDLRGVRGQRPGSMTSRPPSLSSSTQAWACLVSFTLSPLDVF